MLVRLSSGEVSVQELSKPLRISGPAVTKHLKVLERGGLISRGRDAQWRPCRLEEKPLADAVEWLDTVRAQWSEHLDQLQQYLSELQSVRAPAAKTKSRKRKDREPK